MAAFLCSGTSYAQQPYQGCWHPDDIKNWSPETDPDAKFNRSLVPLAKRFKEPTVMKANNNQHYEGQICNATILYPTCSMCPSQGANNFLGYQPTYWQYMDKLVYWAGSASEGIICPPPAGSTDAAHLSGVKSLGQIFFPPSAYGGQQTWVRQILTKENGKYIYAQKLYEIAKYMGFDGWFINEETGGGSTSEWVDFIKEFNKVADENGDTQMEIQWYNASRSPNEAILATHKNTSQFLEYGSPGDYRGYADNINCTVEETFSKIYGGVQVVNSGHTGYQRYLDRAMPVDGHVGSLDLFCPEERIWKDNVKNLIGKEDTGEKAYAAITKTFQNEEQMWVNMEGDPSYTAKSGWSGLSGRMVERSNIQSMPFVSSFCVGVGKHRFVEGEKVATQDWYHSGVQSIMPTWRWWIENKGDLKASIDWDDAYNFGSSMKFTGKLTAGDHLMRLYKTMIKVENGGTLRLVYKTSTAGSVEVKLSTESSTTPDVTLSAPKTSEKNGWSVAEYDLSALNGKTVYMIALNLKADADVAAYSLNLGEMAVLPAGYAPVAVEVTNLASTSVLGESKGDIRLTWDYTYNDDFDHFDIYTERPDGVRTLVGQTRGTGFYIPTFDRNANDAFINVEVVPVMKDMRQQQAKTMKLDYPKATAPVVTFSLDKSYIQVGEKAIITATGTGAPTAWKWTLPDGLKLDEGSSLTDATITVVAVKEGKQEVSVDATNAIGTSTTKAVVLDVMSADDMKEVTNVVLNKTVVGYSGSTNSTEVPDNIIDGVQKPTSTSQKWCNVSSDNWVTFDLEGAYRIYGFKIFDGNSGPETGVDQIDSYQILLSQDGQNWTTVVDRENEADISIKEAYIPPFKARYVKLVPHVNGTLRIWEFEVYGKDDNNMTVEAPAELKMNAGETQNISVKYALNGDERAEQFTCKAVASNDYLTVGEIKEDKAAGTFTIPVSASKALGVTNLTVTIDNGGSYKERTINVTIDSDEQPNVLKGMTAELRKYHGDYGFSTEYTKYDVTTLTDGDTDKEGCESVEEYSNNKDDVWAIFTAPADANKGKWNLSKVKVYIPNANKGVNDNDKEGFVNNEISIRIGNDITNLTTVKTFSELGEVSELEYVLPKMTKCKYVAVVCNLNPYFYASLAEIEAFEQFADAIPNDGTVEVANWNQDVIAEAKPAKEHSTAPLDEEGWVLYTTDVQEKGAVAGADHIVKSKNGTEFELADYTKNNAYKLGSVYSYEDINLKEPVNCEEIRLLTISTNGTSKLTIKLKYEDGTDSESKDYDVRDWFNKNASGQDEIGGIGRMMTENSKYQVDQIDDPNFMLVELTIPADKSKKVTAVSIMNTAWGKVPTILSVYKKGGNKTTNGISNVENNAGVREVVGIYTIDGMKVNTLQKGINIIRYSDGSAKKVLKK